MASWQNSSGKENHKSLFENVSHDRCIMCNSDRTEIARTDFTIMFSEFEYNTGSICKSCYHANAVQVKAVYLNLKNYLNWLLNTNRANHDIHKKQHFVF